MDLDREGVADRTSLRLLPDLEGRDWTENLDPDLERDLNGRLTLRALPSETGTERRTWTRS